MKAAVFDLDGTLVDSAPDIHAAAAAMLEEIGKAPLDLATIRSFIGNGVPTLVERVMRARSLDGARHAELLARFMRHYEAAPAVRSTLYPGLVPALDLLARAGWRLGVCTNKPDAASRAVLAHFGLAARFSIVIGGDALPVNKPDPRPLAAAFAALGATSGVYVGDSEVDAATAEAASVPFVLFEGGYRKAPVAGLPHAASFRDHAELPGILEQVLRAASRAVEPAPAAGRARA